jgi:hypothetical protein
MLDPIGQPSIIRQAAGATYRNPNWSSCGRPWTLSCMPRKLRLRLSRSGRVYHAFSTDLNVTDVDIVSGLPLLVGMDFNVNPMTAVLPRRSVMSVTFPRRLSYPTATPSK